MIIEREILARAFAAMESNGALVHQVEIHPSDELEILPHVSMTLEGAVTITKIWEAVFQKNENVRPGHVRLISEPKFGIFIEASAQDLITKNPSIDFIREDISVS